LIDHNILRSLYSILAAVFVLSLFSPALLAGDYFAKDYGVAGDGITDDGPAIQSALDDMLSVPGEHRLIFEPSKQYYVKDIQGTYLLSLVGSSGITIEGNGSEFILDGAKRFLHAKGSEDIVVRNLSIDYRPLPFVEGTIIAVNQSQGYVDVRIDNHFTMPPLGGPTNDPAEQAYFGLVWYDGPNSLLSVHYYVKDMHESYTGSSGDRILRVDAANFSAWDRITVNKDRISLPVRGIAHMGGEHAVRFVECQDVDMDSVNIWSAPWFALALTRNSGHVNLRNVNVMPRPETPRILSSWRDGMHVKSNYSALLFEDCRLEGMGDDAFNIATFMSSVKYVISDDYFQIKQNYPLNIVPYKIGDMVVVYDITGGKILGRSKVIYTAGFTQPETPNAPTITIQLEDPIPGVDTECAVWNESSANPNTHLKRCEIYKSCRFQSSVTIEKCNITALSWFYGANIEGPLPSNVIVKNSRLALGRGNDVISVSFNTNMKYDGVAYAPQGQPITNVLLQGNVIDGNLVIKHCRNVSVIGNTFSLQRSAIEVSHSRNLLFRDNSFEYLDINSTGQIDFKDNESLYSAVVETSDNILAIDLMKPFAHWTGIYQNGSRTRYHTLPDEVKPVYLEEEQILGTARDCYRLNLPLSTDSVVKICLEEPPYPNTTNMRFWSYTGDEACQVGVCARFPEGDTIELFRTTLITGILQNHDIAIPDIDGGVLEIHGWSDVESGTRKEVYYGDIELSVVVTGSETKDNTGDELQVFMQENPGSFSILLPESRGRLDVFDLNGRLLKRMQVNGFHRRINISGLPAGVLILTFAGKHSVLSRKIITGLNNN
jgi:hypothetical protein